MKDEILKIWYTMSIKDKQEALDKFNVDTLGGIMENQKIREYIKTNFKLVESSTIPRSKLLRRESNDLSDL
jgi:hypothetical protein